MWFEYNPEEAVTTEVIVSAYYTGYEIPENPGRFLGTVLIGDGAIVWHIYSST
jgi:hypothetical protein